MNSKINQLFPDYAYGNLFSGAANSYTTPVDCYVVYISATYLNGDVNQGILQIDGHPVDSNDYWSQNNTRIRTFAGYVKKGSVITTLVSQFGANNLKVYRLTQTN